MRRVSVFGALALVASLAGVIGTAGPALASFGDSSTSVLSFSFRDNYATTYPYTDRISLVAEVVDATRLCEVRDECHDPHGSIDFFDGSVLLGSAPLHETDGSGLSYTDPFPYVTTSAGLHTITAKYVPGDFEASTAETSFTILPGANIPTSTSLTSSANPSGPTQPVTFTAAVAASGNSPTGTVTFLDGSTTLGTVAVGSGSATLATSSLAVGNHSITAAYGGDATYAASASAPLTQSVLPCTITAPASGGGTSGTAGNDVICGGPGNDDLWGGGGVDILFGGGGRDRLSGGDGNDVVSGGDGDDQLVGGLGDDHLYGDAGTDWAVGNAGTDTCSAEAVATCES